MRFAPLLLVGLLASGVHAAEAPLATVTLTTPAITYVATAGATLVLQCPGLSVRYAPGSAGSPPTATATSFLVNFLQEAKGWPIQLSSSEDRISLLGPVGGKCYVYTQSVPPLTNNSLSACLLIRHTVVSVGVTPVAVPTSGQLNRRYVEVCVSAENSGSPKVKCAVDPAALKPAMGLSEPGDVLQTGALPCISYGVDSTHIVWCVSDTAATAVTTNECVTP